MSPDLHPLCISLIPAHLLEVDKKSLAWLFSTGKLALAPRLKSRLNNHLPITHTFFSPLPTVIATVTPANLLFPESSIYLHGCPFSKSYGLLDNVSSSPTATPTATCPVTLSYTSYRQFLSSQLTVQDWREREATDRWPNAIPTRYEQWEDTFPRSQINNSHQGQITTSGTS
ncbi:hypothetical protein BJX62DRAFT_235471 [Aspergillus germanicus]